MSNFKLDLNKIGLDLTTISVIVGIVTFLVSIVLPTGGQRFSKINRLKWGDHLFS
jgi:hypothetical protein